MAAEWHAQPNKGMEPTARSVRCAPASGSGSYLAFGTKGAEEKPEETPTETLYTRHYRE
jgi:hypothetical protein